MRIKTREQLEVLSMQNQGVITARAASSIGLSPRTLSSLKAKGELVQIARGVYQLVDPGEVPVGSPDYAAIRSRVPDGVLCLISALYHHRLTTEIPRCIHLAIHRNSHIPRIDHPPVRFFRMSSVSFSSGVESQMIDGVLMNIYSREKTIADCFKYRGKLGTDLAIEALKSYLSQPGSRPTLVYEMANVCRVGNVIKPYLDSLL